LKVCEFYVASPLECVAGMSGGNLKRRIEEIMSRVQKLSAGKKLLPAGLAMLAVAAPTMVGCADCALHPRSILAARGRATA
jgi:hypothetical protein